ncbi:MAG: polysulfide reductase NrfD [Chloroflexi bacterium]|nr:polysulfide reductase NrfD [Chloroflexota bacterium]
MTGQQPHGQPASVQDVSQKGYYGVPVIHRPHWKWLVTGYFFLGGISGASAVIAAFGRLCGGSPGASVARVATYVSVVALVPCPPLLILDLGRPGRFLNMLRVFRTSSPMSVGTWGLTAFGLITALSTLLQMADDLAPGAGPLLTRTRRTASSAVALLGAISGFFVAGYTGVLLAATAVPLWSKRPALLGPLFLSSAMTSAAAAITATAILLGPDAEKGTRQLRTLETLATVAEGSLLFGWLMALGPTAKPLSEGRIGMIVRHGIVGAGVALPLIVSAALDHLPRRTRRPATLIASALTLSGGFALRYAVVEGGRLSADDPQATFEMTG